MNISEVNYITDRVEGSSLTIETKTLGWVEYVQQHYRVFASKSWPADLYQQESDRILNNFVPENIGFVSHLLSALDSGPFVFPAFGLVKESGFKMSCGASRLAAHISSGQDRSTYGLVILTDQDFNREGFTEIQSTQQFSQFFDLDDLEYRIKLTEADWGLEVGATMLRHTFYDNSYVIEVGQIVRIEKDITGFWERFFNEERNRYKIAIHCLPQHRQFVNQSSWKRFDIKWIDENPEEWQFSFGKLLGQFRVDKHGNRIYSNELMLWLFDVTEPFSLEVFYPLLNVTQTCVYTENKKAVIFDPAAYTDIKICGNIVK